MAKKMKQLYALTKFGPERCPAYLRLPWLGSVSTRLEKQAKSAVKPRVVNATKEFLSAPHKDVLPALQKNNLIYQF